MSLLHSEPTCDLVLLSIRCIKLGACSADACWPSECLKPEHQAPCMRLGICMQPGGKKQQYAAGRPPLVTCGCQGFSANTNSCHLRIIVAQRAARNVLSDGVCSMEPGLGAAFSYAGSRRMCVILMYLLLHTVQHIPCLACWSAEQGDSNITVAFFHSGSGFFARMHACTIGFFA